MFKKIISAAAVLAFAASTVTNATAANLNTSVLTINAQLAVATNCTFSNTGAGFIFNGIATTSVAPTSNDTSSNVNLSYACSAGTAVPAFSLSDGGASGATSYTLTGQATTATIPFSIFQDSVATGTQVNQQISQAITAAATSGNIVLQANILAANLAGVQPDTYNDTVTATLTF